VEVFRIDGRNDLPDPTPIKPGEPTIAGCAILSKGKDQDREFAGRLAEVLLDEQTYADLPPPCFWPGVVFRAWKGNQCVDAVLCFTCGNLYLGPPSERHVPVTASFVKSRSGAFARLARLAKEAFPDDKEIQALEEK
jgi:hypothetical protein